MEAKRCALNEIAARQGAADEKRQKETDRQQKVARVSQSAVKSRCPFVKVTTEAPAGRSAYARRSAHGSSGPAKVGCSQQNDRLLVSILRSLVRCINRARFHWS